MPLQVADRLGLCAAGARRRADGRVEEVDMTAALTLALVGRETETSVMVLGERLLLGVTMLEELGPTADCHRN